MICNPAKFFVNGNQELSFEYEGGSKLYHFSPHDSGLNTTFDMDVVFFANDPKHAKDVLCRMLTFKLGCLVTYTEQADYHSTNRQPELDRTKMYLENIGKWLITEAPMNQFYLAGWAANDTI